MMRFNNVVRDSTGVAVENATIYVYIEDSMVLATIYDGTGAAVSQPLTTDADGYIRNGATGEDGLGFKAVGGRFRIDGLKDGQTLGPIPDILIGDAQGKDTGTGDDELPANSDLCRITTKDVAGGIDVTLTEAEAQARVLVFTGALTANINVVVPDKAWLWLVANDTTGSFTLTVKTSAGTGIAVPQGREYGLRSDGVNVVQYTGTMALEDAGGYYTSAEADAEFLNSDDDAATQADQEAATSTTTYVSPARQHYHQSAAKAWVNFNGTGTVAIRDSYNVSSITDNGTGNWNANLGTPMADANYGFTFAAQRDEAGGANPAFLRAGNSSTAIQTGSINVIAIGGGTNDTLVDATVVSVAIFGDQ